MLKDQQIWMAQSDKSIFLNPALANRHGLIAGATGTGKTITMKVMAESFSDLGVPVFFADVKGDLTGMCKPGIDTEDMQKRIARFGIENFTYKPYPTRFWDLFGEMGHPVRVTISDMGPALLGRLLGLTEVQMGVLNIVFRAADDQGLLLLDLKDLRTMLAYVGENREEYTLTYGNVTTASVGAIQRALLAFEEEGSDQFFGEPALDVRDFMRTDLSGRGYINILSSSKLIHSPLVYSTFLLWMLSELYEQLPEVGDLEKPRFVFFFDEAHLLFKDANKALVSKIEQIIKLIRSKGVGVYFVTQSPGDVPSAVLAQLNNRVQHGLNAYTPAEQKAIKAVAAGFRANAAFKTEEAVQELGVGEALVSFLEKDGVPAIVERAKILPPQSLMGAANEADVKNMIAADEFDLKYRTPVDRESAFEIINRAIAELQAQQQAEAEAAAAEAAAEAERIAAEKAAAKEAAEAEKQAAKEAAAAEKAAAKEAAEAEKQAAREAAAAEKAAAKEAAEAEKAAAKKSAAGKKVAEKAVNSAASSVARSVSSNLVNAVTGGKTASGKTIAKRAATNALSSVMRSGSSAIIRGLFGTKK